MYLTMSHYKLTYFNLTGLGEPIRYLFSYGNIPFEDIREDRDKFDKFKSDAPFGKLPYLEFDGKILTQSSAICRYIAKQVGLQGRSDWHSIQADAVVDTINDLRLTYVSYVREENETAKAIKLEEILSTHNPYYFSRFEKIIEQSGGYFVDGQLTWADIFFASIAETFINVTKEPLLDAYPGLKALREKVQNLPGIKEYRAKRPITRI